MKDEQRNNHQGRQDNQASGRPGQQGGQNKQTFDPKHQGKQQGKDVADDDGFAQKDRNVSGQGSGKYGHGQEVKKDSGTYQENETRRPGR
jgi:hypothetical protein